MSKNVSRRDDERAWALLMKHGTARARQRWEGRRLVRVDLLLEPSDAARLAEVVNEVNRRSPRRLSRAEVGRHLLARSVMQCIRHIRRLQTAERRAARKASTAE